MAELTCKQRQLGGYRLGPATAYTVLPTTVRTKAVQVPAAVPGGSSIHIATCIGALVGGGAKNTNESQANGSVHAFWPPESAAPRATRPIRPAVSRTTNAVVAMDAPMVCTASSAAGTNTPGSSTCAALRGIRRLAPSAPSAGSWPPSP